MESMNRTTPVYFLLRDHVLALDLVGPADVFRHANRYAESIGRTPYFALHFVSTYPRIRSSIGIELAGFSRLPARLPVDAILVLSGCSGEDDDFSSAAEQALVQWLQQRMRPSHKLLCICTGALLAGHAGLLDGRQCTTHHAHTEALRKLAPRAQVLENRIFVEDDQVYTSAGVTAGIDLALHLLMQIAGHACSAAVARSLVVYLRRTGSDLQLSPWQAGRNHLHPAVHKVQDAIVGNPARDWNLPQLAQVACTSERHLARLFREHTGAGPVDYLQRIRVALARELLSQSRLDMEQIAEQSGFHSTRQLRRVWGKFEAAPPSRHRSNTL